MISPPEKKAAPRANRGRQITHDTRIDSESRDNHKPQVLCHSDRYRERAEEASRQLISSWLSHGPKGINECEPSTMPGILGEVAVGVLDAMLQCGARDFADVRPHFIGAPPGVLAELSECASAVPPSPDRCQPLLEAIREWHHEYRLDLIAAKILEAREHGESAADAIREFADVEGKFANGDRSLRERAYSMRFNPDEAPPPDETCMALGAIPIAARGNLTVIQGKSKAGKSAKVSGILGAALRGNEQAAHGDTLGIKWVGESNGGIIHIDTEQSPADWHALVTRGVTRSGLPTASSRLVSLPLVMFARSERLEILEQTLQHEMETRGAVDLVVIDGIADLCVSPNDEAEALELVSHMMALAQKYQTAIVCVVHENPSTQDAKTRGHLGSELNRKAFANLRIDKDGRTGVSTIYGTDMRKQDIPKDQGFCFAWDNEAGMHTFRGRAAGVKAAMRKAEASAKARDEWEPIFTHVAAQRESSGVPALTPKEAAEAEREITGKTASIKPEAMKKRMHKAQTLGVLGKSDALHWTLIPAGTAGKQREK